MGVGLLLGECGKIHLTGWTQRPPLEDLKKALFYLQKEIELLEGANG
jgi:hypothetical protein